MVTTQLFVVENGQTTSRPVGDIGVRELSENYNILASGDGYGIAVPVRFATDEKKMPKLDNQMSAKGATAYGTGIRGDYNPEFEFPSNLERYREMRMDAQVRSALRVAKSPVLAARWFMAPATDAPEDRERATYIWNNLTRWMSTSWPQSLMESLYMLDYGFYILEKVFIKGPDGLVRWSKWAPVHPTEVIEPIYAVDGGYEAVKVSVEKNEEVEEVDIPIEQLLIFTYDKESGNMMGMSALRSCYKHWFIKENLLKIDAIQKERHAIGIPIIMLPINYNRVTDVPVAHQIGENLRGNESAHVVLPPNWEIKFAKLEGNNVDPLKSAEYHGRMIYENFLVNFTDKNPSTMHVGGSDETFMKGTRFIAEIIRDVINRYAIPQLYDWNYDEPETGYPELKVRRLGDTTDWRTMSFAHRNYAGAKILTPDDELENWVREEMDLPLRDPGTSREAVDSSRQTKPSATPPRGNAGTDRSGG